MNMYNLFIFFNLIMFIMMIIPSNLISFHPLILSILLTFYVIILSLVMNFVSSNYWYSYILFLIMVGGLMILFMYFTSIASNDLINLNKNYLSYYLLKLFMILLMFLGFLFIDKKFIYKMEFLEIYSIFSSLIELNDYSIKNLYMDFSMDLNMFMILYLFMTMISCVLLCLKIMLPFRQMNYD